MSSWMHRRLSLALMLLTAGACGGNPSPGGAQPGSGGSGAGGVGGSGGTPAADAGPDQSASDATPDPAVGLPLQPSAASMQELASLRTQLAASPKTAAELIAARAVSFLDKLPYDPAKAAYLDKVQASPLALSPTELTALGSRGFALSARPQFLNFVHGYRAIYAAHLPLYVSADSILFALHRSYDAMLRTIEETTLIGRLGNLLRGMRTRLPATKIDKVSAEATADVDLYLAVALALLDGKPAAPVAGGDAAQIASFVSKASSDDGTLEKPTIFGQVRLVDYSQFKPRGHYTRSPALMNYFRAMMWLGRTEFRLIETLEDGRQVFRRRQMEGSLLVRALVDAPATADWKAIDDVVRAFVGEPDDMTLPDLARLLTGSDAAALLAQSDQAIAQKLIDGGYGAQRIASQVMVNGLDNATLPLHRSFLLLGQRYILDSHVFSNVVYDRVKQAAVKRMMPNPLDVAFAALGNDAAAGLLTPELNKYDYATELADVRTLADAHGADFWSGNLYTLWLSALRALSPAHDLRGAAAAGLPTVTATEPWSRRILSAQLASWAELRHDTILYSKQSYTGVPACEYPDAYVDPYPAFWAKLADLGKRGRELIPAIGVGGSVGTTMAAHFGKLEDVARLLGDMAERQRTGTPFTEAQLVFINQAVSIMPFGCAGSIASGWYPALFYDPADALAFDPTIADVHTQPADEGGGTVGKVLHVATGKPRLMVVTVDGCSGPRAYTGLASAYYETITSDFKRIDDKEWSAQLSNGEPAGVPEVTWMRDLVVR